MNQLDSTPTLRHSLLSLIGTNIVDYHYSVSNSIGQSDDDCMDHVSDDDCMDHVSDEYDPNHIIFPLGHQRKP